MRRQSLGFLGLEDLLVEEKGHEVLLDKRLEPTGFTSPTTPRVLALEEAPGQGQESAELGRFWTSSSMEEFVEPRSPPPLRQLFLAGLNGPSTQSVSSSNGVDSSAQLPDMAHSLMSDRRLGTSVRRLSDSIPSAASSLYCLKSFGSNKVKANLLHESLPYCSELGGEEEEHIFYRPATQADLCTSHPAVDPATWNNGELKYGEPTGEQTFGELWQQGCAIIDPSGDSSNDAEERDQAPANSSDPCSPRGVGFDDLIKAVNSEVSQTDKYYVPLANLLYSTLVAPSLDQNATESRGPTPAIGEDHQAVLPNLLTPEEQALAKITDAERAGTLEWSPDKLDSEQVDKYLAYVDSVLENEYSLEEALRRLHQHHYDVNRTLAAFLLNPSDFKKQQLWSEEEEARFPQAYYLYRKDWSKWKQMFPNKSPASVMQYYYNWRSAWYSEDEEEEEEEEDEVEKEKQQEQGQNKPKNKEEISPNTSFSDWPGSDERGLPAGSRKRRYEVFLEQEDVSSTNVSVVEDEDNEEEEIDVVGDVPSSSSGSLNFMGCSTTSFSEDSSEVKEKSGDGENGELEETNERRSKRTRFGSAPLESLSASEAEVVSLVVGETNEAPTAAGGGDDSSHLVCMQGLGA